MGLSDMLGDVYDEDDDAVDPPLVSPPEAEVAPPPEPEPVVAAFVEPEAEVAPPPPEPEPEPEPVVAAVAAVAAEEDVFSLQATPGSEWANDTALDAAFADWQPEGGAVPDAEDLAAIPMVEEISSVPVADLEVAAELPKPKRRGLFGLGNKKDKSASDLIEEAIEELEAELAPEAPAAKKERKPFFGIGKKKETKSVELPAELALSDLDEASYTSSAEETLVTIPAAPRGPMLSDDLLPNRKVKK